MKYFILISLLSLTALAQEAPVSVYKGTLSERSTLPNAPCEIDVYAAKENVQPIKMIINNNSSERIELQTHFLDQKKSSMTSKNTEPLNGKNLTVMTSVGLDLSKAAQATLNYYKTWSKSDFFTNDSAIVQQNHFYCVATAVLN